MDFKQLIQYLNSLYDTFRKDWKTFNNSQIDAIKENTQAIENTEAIKAIPSVEIPKTDFTPLAELYVLQQLGVGWNNLTNNLIYV